MAILMGDKNTVMQQVVNTLERKRLRINRLAPIWTTSKIKAEIEMIKHSWKGVPSLAYAQAGATNSIVYEPTNVAFPIRDIPFTIREKALDRFINEHNEDAYIMGNQANRIINEMGVEEGYYDWLIKGVVDGNKVDNSLFAVNDSQEIFITDKSDNSLSKSEITVSLAKANVLKAFDKINKAGANSYSLYTLLLPADFRDIFTDFISSGITLVKYLFDEYGIICDFSEDYPHSLLYQSTSGNMAFHKINSYFYRDGLDLEKDSYISKITAFGAGLIVADPKQIANLKLTS